MLLFLFIFLNSKPEFSAIPISQRSLKFCVAFVESQKLKKTIIEKILRKSLFNVSLKALGDELLSFLHTFQKSLINF